MPADINKDDPDRQQAALRAPAPPPVKQRRLYRPEDRSDDTCSVIRDWASI